MPLPPNGTLSLQGHAGPGGTDASKSKQAMIVRMSTETFEALETQPNPPKLEVEFGDSPVRTHPQ
jgi:RNA polymerase II elongation factor ELL